MRVLQIKKQNSDLVLYFAWENGLLFATMESDEYAYVVPIEEDDIRRIVAFLKEPPSQ